MTVATMPAPAAGRDTGRSRARASVQGNGSRDPYRAPQARDPQHQHPARPPTAPVPQPFFAACRFCLPALSSKPGRPGSPLPGHSSQISEHPNLAADRRTTQLAFQEKHRRRQPTPTPLDDSPRDFQKASHTCTQVPATTFPRAVVTASMPVCPRTLPDRGRPAPANPGTNAASPTTRTPGPLALRGGRVVGLAAQAKPQCRRGRAACRLCSASAHLAAHLAAHQQAASGGRGRALPLPFTGR